MDGIIIVMLVGQYSFIYVHAVYKWVSLGVSTFIFLFSKIRCLPNLPIFELLQQMGHEITQMNSSANCNFLSPTFWVYASTGDNMHCHKCITEFRLVNITVITVVYKLN